MKAFAICITITIISFSCFHVVAQKHRRKLRLVEVPWDSTIKGPIIPNNIFSSNAEGLVMSYQQQSKVKNQTKSVLAIFWSAPNSIDGEYLFIITKRQLILTSGHENPNPDYLYWFTDITLKQHDEIVKNVDDAKNSFDEQHLDYCYARELHYKKFIQEKQRGFTKANKNIFYRNAKKLIDLFNKGLAPAEMVRFPNTADFNKIQQLITAGSANEINDFIIKYD
jgi:hypothetical protein